MKHLIGAASACLLTALAFVPANAATPGQLIIQKPNVAVQIGVVQKAGWHQHRRWHHRRWHHRHYYRGWGWRHHHHRRWR